MRAYEVALRDEEPFTVQQTARGTRLELLPQFWSEPHRHLYVYAL
jgi:hypothetical protein